MKNALEKYLKENIDENITIDLWDDKQRLPMFLSDLYQFYLTNILGEKCLLIEAADDIQGIENIKKHIKAISKSIESDWHVVLLFKTISAFRRKSLIKERIPFIVENGQAYLPFILLDLKKNADIETSGIDGFSPTTQFVYLYFLYNENLSINATELAGLLNSSVMTAIRALNDLYLLGLLYYDISGKTGRSKAYKRIEDTEYYSKGKEYLKNPISSTIYVEATEDIMEMPIAGLEALSLETMINPPKRSIRAVYKKRAADLKAHAISNRDKINDLNLVEIQLWNYEPKLLTKNNMIDLVSMMLSINTNNDERIEQALEERLKGETWYMV